LVSAFFSAALADDSSEKPSYISDQDYKILLIERIQIPRTMDRNYHKKLRERKELIKDIESGKLDKEVILGAAQYNLTLATKCGDVEMAKLFEREVSAARSVVEAERAAETAERARASAAFREIGRETEIMLLKQEVFRLSFPRP
jgi:hypothetical protein